MFSTPYRFLMPTRVVYGMGISKEIGPMIKPYLTKKVLIVTDKGVRHAQLLSGIEKSLKDSDLQFEIFDDVEPNPSADIVHQGLNVYRESDCDVVLAVGGGSSIDTGKGIAAMANNEGNILDYEGVDKLPNPTVPLFAVPTNAGTGSEVTASAVITNKKTLFKTAIISSHLFPKMAILDPILTISVPPAITAATGMDALTHAIESYTSKRANPVSDALAIQAIRLIGASLHKAYFAGTDLESRDKMFIASIMAGAAFAQSRLGNVHAISQSFGGVFNIPHGIANATLLPFVMKFNLPACPEKMRDIAEALVIHVSGLSVKAAAEKAIEAVIEMNKAFNIPDNIKELGVTLDRLPQLVEDSMKSGNVLVNPRLTTAKDVQRIIENAYYGRLVE